MYNRLVHCHELNCSKRVVTCDGGFWKLMVKFSARRKHGFWSAVVMTSLDTWQPINHRYQITFKTNFLLMNYFYIHFVKFFGLKQWIKHWEKKQWIKHWKEKNNESNIPRIKVSLNFKINQIHSFLCTSKYIYYKFKSMLIQPHINLFKF